MDRERERERGEKDTESGALTPTTKTHERANAHIPPAPDGAACFTGGWGFLYLAVGTVRRSRVYTRRLAALCMFAVAEENLNQLPPPIYPLCLSLSLSLHPLRPPDLIPDFFSTRNISPFLSSGFSGGLGGEEDGAGNFRRGRREGEGHRSE